MRYTLQAWWCGVCKQRNDGHVPGCSKCGASRIERHAQIHASERAVIYEHPLTGERRTPPRSDMPMPEVYARQGFERREILHMGAYERETGSVHEASNFHAGNEDMDVRPAVPSTPPEVTQALVDDFRAAAATGWTSDDNEQSKVFSVPVPLKG